MDTKRVHAALDELVTAAIATACRIEPASLDHRTPLADIGMDSLTLVAVLSEIEALCEIELSAADTAELLAAKDIGEIVARLAPRIAPNARNSVST
jgi:hypothetical protein